MASPAKPILIANIGSTSFKYRLFDMGGPTVLAQGKIERIGRPGGECANYEVALGRCLDTIGVRHYFDGIVGGDMVARGKPDPEIFLLAARQLRAQPARCVVIEDSPAGVTAARRAGMRAIAVCTQYTPPGLVQGAHLTVNSLAEVYRT